MLQIGRKSEKWQWPHNLSTWRHCQFFWRCLVSLVDFSYWSKFHVNIIPNSGVMIIFFYKGLTRNPEIGNTPAWVLPKIWRLEQVRDTKFGRNVSNEMLLNAAKGQGYWLYHCWVIKGKLAGGIKLPHPPTLGLNYWALWLSGLSKCIAWLVLQFKPLRDYLNLWFWRYFEHDFIHIYKTVINIFEPELNLTW